MIDRYFKQLPIKIDMLDSTKMDLIPRRAFNNKTYYSSINNPEYANYLNNLFKELNPRDVSYCEFPGAWPHIDHDNSKCAINHYYVTQNVETVYYDPKPGARPFQGIDEEASCFFNKEDIIEANRFCAPSNTVWLLDITKIHGLEFPHGFGPLRTFVKWRIDMPYDEVYGLLFEKIIPKLNAEKIYG